jgi:integrase
VFRAAEAALTPGWRPADIVDALEAFRPEEPEVLTYEAIRRSLSPLDYLWALRHHLRADRLHFDPFPDGLTALARDLGQDIDRTPTVPPRQAMELLDRSIRWVMDYADPILTAYERALALRDRDGQDIALASANALAQAPAIPEGPGSPVRLIANIRRRGADVTGVTVPLAVKYLVLACFIVIAAFTARRLDEVLSIKPGCTRGNVRDGHWIRTYIEKTLQSLDETPCPAVAYAVEHVLERLNRLARTVDPDCSLSVWLAVDVNEPRRLRHLQPSKDLDGFAELVGVSKLSGGSIWHFTPHQFRRFFAITYVWRYQHGDLGALAHHLRHFNLRMTQRYVTEAIAGLILEEEKALTRTVFVEAARVRGGSVARPRSVSGGFWSARRPR